MSAAEKIRFISPHSRVCSSVKLSTTSSSVRVQNCWIHKDPSDHIQEPDKAEENVEDKNHEVDLPLAHDEVSLHMSSNHSLHSQQQRGSQVFHRCLQMIHRPAQQY